MPDISFQSYKQAFMMVSSVDHLFLSDEPFIDPIEVTSHIISHTHLLKGLRIPVREFNEYTKVLSHIISFYIPPPCSHNSVIISIKGEHISLSL